MTPTRILKTTLGALMGATLMMGGAQAANFSKSVYNGAKDDIKASYKAQRDGCSGQSGNAKDVCVEYAKGYEKMALARLEYDYTGAPKDELAWIKASYEARYDIAKEKCDDATGDAKNVCQREAKTVRDKAEADHKLAKKVVAAVDDAESTKLKADYKLAKERCDGMSGEAKDVCNASAKARFPA